MGDLGERCFKVVEYLIEEDCEGVDFVVCGGDGDVFVKVVGVDVVGGFVDEVEGF